MRTTCALRCRKVLRRPTLTAKGKDTGLFKAVLAYAKSAIKPSREGMEATGRSLDMAELAPAAAKAPAAPTAAAEPESKVELF